jgi:hypothetical protein
MEITPGPPLVLTCFIIWAETLRLWRRVVVSATFEASTTQQSYKFATQPIYVNYESLKTLPNVLENLLNRQFSTLALFPSTTRFSMTVRERHNGQLWIVPEDFRIAEDVSERKPTRWEGIVQQLADMSCPTYIESQVIAESRILSTSYVVFVGNRRCIEQKAPFASLEARGEGDQHTFLDALRLHLALRNCANVSEFYGIVLDDSRSYLSGYLYERPPIICLGRVIAAANAEGTIIPWQVRERWALEITCIVSSVHRKTIPLAALGLNSYGLRADGSVVLVRFQTSTEQMRNKNGFLPPELRHSRDRVDAIDRLPPVNELRVNIFQLGYVLWLLADHRKTQSGRFCAMAACTSFPRLLCSNEHTNPVQLPPLRNIPAYFVEIINKCRAADPAARPPAQDLIKAFPSMREEDASIAANIANSFSDRVSFFWTQCDECGEDCRNFHYHCNICYAGDFDLCSACFDNGVRCLDPTHQLGKIYLKEGEYVDIT